MIQALHLRNFRSYRSKKFIFGPHINLICGANGQGKTNLLEAISLITTGRSFRTNNLLDLIHQEEKFFTLEASLLIDDVETKVNIYLDKEEKKLKINSSYYKTFSPLIGQLPSIFHTPKDMELITGTPGIRRKFLDLYLSQQDKVYFYHLIRYNRAKKQRDHLLKSKNNLDILYFEKEISKSGVYLSQTRDKLIKQLQEPFISFGKQLSPNKDTPSLNFSPFIPFPFTEKQYEDLFQKNREKEYQAGYTLFGPHRDDFNFTLNDRSTKTFASEGEKRSSTTALRLAEWCLASKQKKALIGIDDITTHLDPFRQQSLKNLLSDLSQAFITIPSPDPKWENIGKVFVIEK